MCRSRDHNFVPAHLFSMKALVALLFLMRMTNQTRREVKDMIAIWLAEICRCSFDHTAGPCSAATSWTFTSPAGQDCAVTVSGAGDVVGFEDLLARCGNRSLTTAWSSRCAVAPGRVIFSEVLAFATENAKGGDRCLMVAVLQKCAPLVASALHRYIMHTYAARTPLESPRRIMRRATSGRVIGGLDATASWSVLERARSLRSATPSTVLSCKNDEQHLTVHPHSSDCLFLSDLCSVFCSVLFCSVFCSCSVLFCCPGKPCWFDRCFVFCS